MTPSVNQRNAQARDYSSWPEKLVTEKNRDTLLAVIRGADDPETLRDIARAEANRDETRRVIVGSAYRRIADIDGGEPA